MNAFLNKICVENMLNYILLAQKSAIGPPKCACLLLHINTKILISSFFFKFAGKTFWLWFHNISVIKNYTFYFKLKK